MMRHMCPNGETDCSGCPARATGCGMILARLGDGKMVRVPRWVSEFMFSWDEGEASVRRAGEDARAEMRGATREEAA
jgi:hypothetical protein